MNLFAALPPESITLWQITLWVGGVVVLVVVALLAMLVRLVNQIDAGVLAVWERAKELAADTATTWQLEAAAEAWEEVHEALQARPKTRGRR